MKAPSAPTPARSRRWKRVLFATLLSFALGLLGLELTFRFLLFSDSARHLALAQRLRNARLYAPSYKSRTYWELYTLFSGGGTKRAHGCFDWRLGWSKYELDPQTLEHVDEKALGDRRPVLLFGDSYASCMKRARVCWQDLLGQSELGERHALLNFGVGGYGLDQAYLLMHMVLPRLLEKNPIVVIGILVGDDLDRCYMPLRRVPKPSFELEGGELRLNPVRISTPRAYLAEHSVDIHSYLWRYLLFGTKLFAPKTAIALSAERNHEREKMALNRAIISAIQSECEAAGLTYFFVLFHSEYELATPGPYDWQEPFLYQTFQDLAIPFVSSKRYLRDYLRNTRATMKSLFFQDAEATNHYNELGNAVVFNAFVDGLRGSYEPYDYLPSR